MNPESLSSWAGRTCVLTGATSGIGHVATERLAQMGVHVVGTGRDLKSCREAETRILQSLARSNGVQGSVKFLAGDYADPASVRDLGLAILDQCPRIDLLIHNVGAMFGRPETAWSSPEDLGVEKTFAVNQLAPFLLQRILEAHFSEESSAEQEMLEGRPRRILVVASEGHRGLEPIRDWAEAVDGVSLSSDTYGKLGWPEYQRSKLANLLFARSLNRRYAGASVCVQALHPGVVGTGFARKAGLPLWRRLWVKSRSISVSDGAEYVLAPLTGAEDTFYWSDGKPESPSDAAQDEASADDLWRFCMEKTESWVSAQEPRTA